MRILPLGGAEEVGASSTIVEFGAYRFLVDAGIRIGAKDGNQLPDLSRLKEEAGPIDAILLTHAHMDHSGALPLVHLAYPDAPIYMTPATYAVLQILFSDSQRIMSSRYKLEGEIPLYPISAIDSCLGRIRPVPFEQPLRLSQGEVVATFHPAGHILGASSISLQGRQGTLLMSGDISVTDQRAIPGMLPPQIKPDVIMVESTYGDRLHAHRPTQEANLVQTVGDILDNGGKVIIPAFAVGRAQEVILILRHAIAQGKLRPFPIYVDGMVQSVCDIYGRFPTYLQHHLRSSVRRGENPFFPAGGTIYRVRSQAQRERILEGEPCCIIASSGMMTGGPSAYYAAALAQDRRSLIAITGYQDEEAPGRRLLELVHAPAEERHLMIDGRDIPIRCHVEKYALSAHADSGEISGLVGQLSPSQGVVLVHGEGDARESLAQMVDTVVPCEVFLPQNGDALSFTAHRRLFYPPSALSSPPSALSTSSLPHLDTTKAEMQPRTPALPSKERERRPLDRGVLSHLHQILWAETKGRGLYRLSDLYARWQEPDAQPTPEELEALKTLIEAHPAFFQADRKRPHLYRPLSLEDQQKKGERKQSPPSNRRLEMNQALEFVASLIPESAGLYKKGARRDEGILLLFFHFPQPAERAYAEQIKIIEEKTGWSVRLNEVPHHAALEEYARRLVPEGWSLQRNPSILHEESAVRLRLYHPPFLDEAQLQQQGQALEAAFLNETGYHLALHFQPLPESPAAPPPAQMPTLPMEINQAYQVIEEAFAALPDRPYKKSKKGDQIVLSFLTPALGERYTDLLGRLEKQTGWSISLNPEPNQHGIKQALRLLLPPAWSFKKEPIILKRERRIRLFLQGLPSPDALEPIAEAICDKTGFVVEIAS